MSLLTGVPLTNTVQQEALIASANPELVSTYGRLAEIYGASVAETLDEADVVTRLPDSIEAIVEEHSFAPYVPAVITTGVPISVAYRIEQESIFLPGVRVIPQPLREYPSGELTAHLIGYMGPVPNQNWIDVLNYERDDRVGWAGLESSMELELAGDKGRRTIEQDWTGREVRQIGEGEMDPRQGLLGSGLLPQLEGPEEAVFGLVEVVAVLLDEAELVVAGGKQVAVAGALSRLVARAMQLGN